MEKEGFILLPTMAALGLAMYLICKLVQSAVNCIISCYDSDKDVVTPEGIFV